MTGAMAMMVTVLQTRTVFQIRNRIDKGIEDSDSERKVTQKNFGLGGAVDPTVLMRYVEQQMPASVTSTQTAAKQ